MGMLSEMQGIPPPTPPYTPTPFVCIWLGRTQKCDVGGGEGGKDRALLGGDGDGGVDGVVQRAAVDGQRHGFVGPEPEPAPLRRTGRPLYGRRHTRAHAQSAEVCVQG